MGLELDGTGSIWDPRHVSVVTALDVRASVTTAGQKYTALARLRMSAVSWWSSVSSL
jgi:hypothetical protein